MRSVSELCTCCVVIWWANTTLCSTCLHKACENAPYSKYLLRLPSVLERKLDFGAFVPWSPLPRYIFLPLQHPKMSETAKRNDNMRSSPMTPLPHPSLPLLFSVGKNTCGSSNNGNELGTNPVYRDIPAALKVTETLPQTNLCSDRSRRRIYVYQMRCLYQMRCMSRLLHVKNGKCVEVFVISVIA